MNIRVVNWSPARRSRTMEVFLQRPAFDLNAERIAAELLFDIKQRGEPALLAAIAKYEGVALKASELRVSQKEIDEAEHLVDANVRKQIDAAHARVLEFSKRSMRSDWEMETPNGGKLGEFFTPLSRVGIYVPGGAAPLASTVIMTATLAQAAGVKEIVACTPGGKNRKLSPEMLYAMKACGVTEVYRIGGIQAIGLMAYGIRHCEPVRKIVGPGGTFVTAAKRQVYGTVALDLVAGPSEIAILADDSANPDHVAADLLSQAEHGSGFEKAMLITDSPNLANEVSRAISRQTAQLSRKEMIKKVIAKNGILLATAPSIEDGLGLINRFAPEHFELVVREPEKYLSRVTTAGAVFVGPWTPEPVGDFAAGPSHVLPTGGAGKMFSGLTVEDFRRRTSLVNYTEQDLRDAMPIIEMFGTIEGLDGHKNSAAIRFKNTK